jgi:hypothetical protein
MGPGRPLFRVLAALCALLLSACAPLPPVGDATPTLLVIPKEFRQVNADTEPFRHYQLELEGRDERIEITPESGYEWVRGLEPGRYRITRVHSLHRSGKRPRATPMDIEFDVEAGKVNLLPYQFEMLLRREEGRKFKYYQYWSMEPLDKQELAEIRRSLPPPPLAAALPDSEKKAAATPAGVDEGIWIGYGDVSHGMGPGVSCQGENIPVAFQVLHGRVTSVRPKGTPGYFETRLGEGGRIRFSYADAGLGDGMTALDINFRGSLSGSRGGGRVYMQLCQGRWQVRRLLGSGESRGSTFLVTADWVLRYDGGRLAERMEAGEGSSFSGLDVLGDFLAVHERSAGQRRTRLFYIRRGEDVVEVGSVSGVHARFGGKSSNESKGLAFEVEGTVLRLTSGGRVVKEVVPAGGRSLVRAEAADDFLLVQAGGAPEDRTTVLFRLAAPDRLIEVGRVEGVHASFR